MDQIRHKLEKKVTSGKQIALAQGRPAVLAIALGHQGASQLEAEWALDEAFVLPEFAPASAVIVSDTWKFIRSTLHVNQKACTPLTEAELSALVGCLGEPRVITAPAPS